MSRIPVSFNPEPAPSAADQPSAAPSNEGAGSATVGATQLTEAFISGARWARMAAEKAFDENLLDEDAKYFAESGGSIQCRGIGTIRHLLRTELIEQLQNIKLAAAALIADVKRRYPGEALRCQYMIALDSAITITEKTIP